MYTRVRSARVSLRPHSAIAPTTCMFSFFFFFCLLTIITSPLHAHHATPAISTHALTLKTIAAILPLGNLKFIVDRSNDVDAALCETQTPFPWFVFFLRFLSVFVNPNIVLRGSVPHIALCWLSPFIAPNSRGLSLIPLSFSLLTTIPSPLCAHPLLMHHTQPPTRPNRQTQDTTTRQ